MNMHSKPSRLILVSGSWPPVICGVGDFMNLMWKELAQSGYAPERLTLRPGNLNVSLRALAASFGHNRLIYISYPTEGYGKSLLPFLLAFGDHRNVVMHIHEYSSKNRYCRFLLRRFQRMDRLFFSNRVDYQNYVFDCRLSSNSPKVAGWAVTPTPSNIPLTAIEGMRSTTRVKIVHFGQIRPNKGLEELVKVMGSLQDVSAERLVIGGIPKGYEVYATEISRLFSHVGVKVRFNLTSEQISQELASAHVGAFAFPDGADERRGSLIAAMAHGVLCVTTHSGRTPQPLKDATIGIPIVGVSTAEAMADALRRAVAEVNIESNRLKVTLSRQIGSKASFRGIAEQLMQLRTTKL
jgi:glycosyltransferase involved in cell wall biosynthesis